MYILMLHNVATCDRAPHFCAKAFTCVYMCAKHAFDLYVTIVVFTLSQCVRTHAFMLYVSNPKTPVVLIHTHRQTCTCPTHQTDIANICIFGDPQKDTRTRLRSSHPTTATSSCYLISDALYSWALSLSCAYIVYNVRRCTMYR